MKMFKGSNRAQRGFTLVEMTVVLAIIAVLAALALPAVTGVTTDSRGTGKGGDQKQVDQALLRYEDSNGGLFATATNTTDSDFTATFYDADGDGFIKALINNEAVATSGTTPSVDVTCGSSATNVADSLLTCLGNIKFGVLVPTYISSTPKHAGEKVKATATNSPDNNLTGDNDWATADFYIENCDSNGATCQFFLENNDSLADLYVWALNKNNSAFTFKEDNVYGKSGS